ncbi:hypothetical protein Tco_1300134 [Tanacetum coccineum]
MSAITDIKCVLSQKAFDSFCEKIHIPEEVHPVLPNHGDTMHERPAGKIGLYTRFFDFANFKLPLSTFLVNILRHFCINISQLSVIGVAKVFHFEILCRVYGITPTVGLFRCFYVNSKKNGWMSFKEFLCLVGWSRHYTLDKESYPQFLDKDREDMDIFAFIHTPDPTKVKVVERERIKDEPRLLKTIVGRIVPLLPVAPDRAESELEASVDKLFDEGGNATMSEEKLREDHETPSGVFIGCKSRASQRFVISLNFSHHSGTNVAKAEVDSLIRSSALVMTTVTVVTPTVDTVAAAKEKPIEPSLFGVASSSAGRNDPTPGGFSDLTGSDCIVGGIRTVISPDTNL